MTDLLCVECIRQAGHQADAAGQGVFSVDRSRSFTTLKRSAGRGTSWQVPSAVVIYKGLSLCMTCLGKVTK